MSAQQSFMGDERPKSGSRAAKHKPFAVECRWKKHDWSIWRRYKKLGDAEKAAKDLPKSFRALKLEARVVRPELRP